MAIIGDDDKGRTTYSDDGSGDDEKENLLSSRDSSPTQPRSPSPEPESEVDPRFNRPTPSPFKRAGLLLFIGLLLWIGFQMRSGLLEAKRKPQVIYASRYSKEHKFRPAASPIITETLKDGRIRLRGAVPTPTATPTPPVVKKKRTGKGKKKSAGKTKKSTGKR